MKYLRKIVFSVLSWMETPDFQIQHSDTKNNNLLKELKACASLCLTQMGEVTGVRLGRRFNMQKEEMADYQNIAFKLAHRYADYLQGSDRTEVFGELMAAGMEGLAQGLAGYDISQGTKVSTFLYSRAKFAVQKQFAVLKKQLTRTRISLNRKIVEDDEDSGFIDMLASDANTADTAEGNVMRDAMHDVLVKLPEHQRVVALMCAEKSPNEVARRTGMHINEVKNLLKEIQHSVEETVHQWCQE